MNVDRRLLLAGGVALAGTAAHAQVVDLLGARGAATIIYADFITNDYRLNNIATTFDQVIDQFTNAFYSGAVVHDGTGLICDPARIAPWTGSFPCFAAPALTALNAAGPNFCSVVELVIANSQPDPMTDVGIMVFRDDTDPGIILLEQAITATVNIDPVVPSVYAIGNGYQSATVTSHDLMIAPPGASQMSMNFWGPASISLSANGGPIVSGTIKMQNISSWDSVNIGPWARGGSVDYIAQVKFIGVYAAPQSNLVQLSGVGYRPA